MTSQVAVADTKMADDDPIQGFWGRLSGAGDYKNYTPTGGGPEDGAARWVPIAPQHQIQPAQPQPVTTSSPTAVNALAGVAPATSPLRVQPQPNALAPPPPVSPMQGPEMGQSLRQPVQLPQNAPAQAQPQPVQPQNVAQAQPQPVPPVAAQMNQPATGGVVRPTANGPVLTPEQVRAYAGVNPVATAQPAAQSSPYMDPRQPASIRTNNPGAQWPGPVAKEFGGVEHQNLKDGNKIAVFPTPVHGAAAQFALLDRKYAGMPLSDAITKWSGGNYSAGYAKRVSEATGIGLNDKITPEMLRGVQGQQLVRAMANHEAGRVYPFTQDQLSQAQIMAFAKQASK